MCGIAGIVYNQNFQDGVKVIPSDFFELLNSYEKKKCTTSEILELCWKYKSNINFIRYSKLNSERNDIKNICLKLKEISNKIQKSLSNIDKSRSYDLYNQTVLDNQNLLDAHWFLSIEIEQWYRALSILSIKDISELSDEKIIFFKDLSKVISAIDNRLELRGRDSFGVSIVMTSAKFNGKENINCYFDNKSEICNYDLDKKSYCFTFKTCNSIGGLGENAEKVRKLILHNSFFQNLIFNYPINSATIMAHTRWASVGKVVLENAHPINYINNYLGKESSFTTSMLNGDIYNYKEIIESAKKKKKLSVDDAVCTSDCLAIPVSLANLREVSINLIAEKISSYTGSFVTSIQHSQEPEKIFVSKKGIQGLYIGFAYDGVMFASDVYGLVESCKYFIPIDSDTSFELSSKEGINCKNPSITIFNHNLKKPRLIKKSDLKITNITTRDIDKKNFDHFLNKEIHETGDIVARTLNNYLQPQEVIGIENIHESIVMRNKQVPDFIPTSLKDRKIKKIIITGMGTCYTAAVAISMYMRDRLKEFLPNILVEPHIASEGSAFYLQSNMQDTLVVVIAQSGTTVDTNVYVQMAKERGAMSLAIANKREGDVTFIVDGTLYIGDGRDIEIAVPSTKTYTAQVILGYILTLFFASKLAENSEQKKKLYNDFECLANAESSIKNCFEYMDEISMKDLIGDSGSKHNSWYVLRDNSTNSVCADEIRIKYSENCYQSVSSLSIYDAIDLNIHKSFMVVMTEDDLNNISSDLIELLDNENSLILISIDSEIPSILKSYIESGGIKILNMPYAKEYFTFIPTIIAGQLLSYFQAMVLDDRKKYFHNIKESIASRSKLKNAWSDLESALRKGVFTQGFSLREIDDLMKLLQSHNTGRTEQNKSSSLSLSLYLLKLIENSRRTIDTIKHQAKTITVGAVRDGVKKSLHEDEEVNSLNQFKNSDNFDKYFLDLIFSSFHDEHLPLSDENIFNYGELLIAYEGIDESYAYNVVNFFNNISNQLNSERKIRLARPYDYPNENSNTAAYWIIISNSKLNKKSSYLKFLKNDQYLFLDFNEWSPNQELREIFSCSSGFYKPFDKAIWSLFIGVFLTNKLLMSKLIKSTSSNYNFQRTNYEIGKQLNFLSSAIKKVLNAEDLNISIDYAAEVFLSKINWKAIGSGVNYNLSKYTAKRLINDVKRACAFDVLENHKHIDISAESAILIFISNIWKSGYQEDAFSEIEKLIAHNNVPIIITNENDYRFDNLYFESLDSSRLGNSLPVIKIPNVGEQYSFALNVIIAEKLLAKILQIKNNNSVSSKEKAAIYPPSKDMRIENIWK